MTMNALESLHIRTWDERCSSETIARAIESLESGAVLFFPRLAFHLTRNELRFLSPAILAPRSKNISLDSGTAALSGSTCTGREHQELVELMLRFFSHARTLVHRLLPRYAEELCIGRTSLRPVEISGRRTSFRTDDTLLHIDAFPAHPVQGSRILRLFSNVNPDGKDRIWKIGGPFEDVARVFASRSSNPVPGSSGLLKALGITTGFRTRYDHIMLQIHDAMKADEEYQQSTEYTEVRFPPGCTWMAFTDQVSHAVSSGQHVLEQTFYIPVGAMMNGNRSPLRVLEDLRQHTLV